MNGNSDGTAADYARQAAHRAEDHIKQLARRVTEFAAMLERTVTRVQALEARLGVTADRHDVNDWSL